MISGDFGSVYTFPTSSKPKVQKSDQHFLGGGGFINNVTFRIQVALCDDITTDIWSSRQRLHDSDLHKAKKDPNRIKHLTKIKASCVRYKKSKKSKFCKKIDVCRCGSLGLQVGSLGAHSGS